MPDGFDFDLVTKPFTDMLGRMDKATDKATLFALRQTGRDAGKAAKLALKPGAGVYRGTDPRATAESGNLRRSIKNAKRVVKVGTGDYSMKVGPFGTTKAGTQSVRHGMRGGSAIDSLTASHLKIAGPSVKKGESTKGQVRGVPLYRAQQELRFGFMAAGVAYVDSGVAKLNFEKSYDTAWARASR